MIWIKLEKVEEESEKLYLPQCCAQHIQKNTTIQFGLRKMDAVIHSIDNGMQLEDNSFEKPIIIRCSEGIINRLLIQESFVYQMVYTKESIIIGPLIGFFLGEQCFYYHDRNMCGFTRGMEIYPYIGGLFIAFKDISIDWDEMKIYGLYFDYSCQKWKYGIFPIPSVVFCRAFDNKKSTIDKLKKLTENKVFNSARLNKWELYKMLRKKKEFEKYLPDTGSLEDINNYYKYIDKYTKVILKPAGLSRGRGICFIHKIEDYYTLYDYRLSGTPRFHMLESDEIADFLIENNFINKDYIIQPHLEFAVINGSPFDIRIVMGKDSDGEWNCRGIECRLAGSRNIITNISMGGQALSINSALRLSFGPGIASNKIKKNLIRIAKDFCSIMDETGEHYAEFGLDFALDKNMKCWFIEANVRPVFRGFKKLDYNNYLHIRHSPLLYAASLAGFGKKVNKGVQKI
jgi:hypothetical protein